MTAARAIGLALWVALLAGGAAVAWAAFAPMATPPARAAPTLAPIPSSTAATGGLALEAAARLVSRRDPFRLGRAPAAVRYDPERQASATVQVVSEPRPALRLVGVVAGPWPVAVIEGFSGLEGPRVVRPGERVGRLRIAAIAPGQVRVLGPDTAWTLTVRRP